MVRQKLEKTMTDVIVTVKHANEARLLDIQLASDIPAERLAASLAQSLGWDRDASGKPISYELEAHPPGRKLRPDETLAEVNAWDGAWLILHPKLTLQPQTRAPESAKGGYTMKRLDSEPTVDRGEPTSHPAPKAQPGSSGYAWKRLDDDH
jgi:hypothetical protein